MQFFENSEQTGFDDLIELDIELVHTNSYDEETLQQKIEDTGLKKELFACALQLAVIGWGKGNYGDVTIDGEKKSLTDVFDETGVYYDNDAGAQLDPYDLTPKRLVRIFRFQIQKWLERKQMQSFLLKKYGAGVSTDYNSVIFPGAEHYIVSRSHANALLKCYGELDRQQNSHFVDRIRVVFNSRRIAYD